ANTSCIYYISTSDGIYVASGKVCLRLDPATGKRISEFRLPPLPGTAEPPAWDYLNVHANYLIGGADPGEGAGNVGRSLSVVGGENHSTSVQLVVMDRHSGAYLWSVTAQLGFRHNSVCAGGGRLYCIDRL